MTRRCERKKGQSKLGKQDLLMGSASSVRYVFSNLARFVLAVDGSFGFNLAT